ncbi:hypothetical protein BU15DRAFT_52263 [Melanogaster broomeanus]|nr:hypothetical protein BU15DRAFT_52263 [Melanogaster broomeanus]
MEIIDISSSPEPSAPMADRTRSASRQPGPSKTRARPTASKHKSIAEVIELTDSEDDPNLRVVLRKKNQPQRRRDHEEHPASSSQAPNAASSFGNARSDLAGDPARIMAPGSSSRREERIVPLFFPSSDDERGVHRPPPADVFDAALVAQLRVVPDAVPPLPPPDPPAPVAPAPPPVDPIGECVARVIEVVPDVQPAHVLGLVEQFSATQPGNVVEFVLHALFEDPSYPKVDKKGKRKRDDTEAPIEEGSARGVPKPKVDYASKERKYDCGPHYFELSLEQLMRDFPRIPKPHIRARLLNHLFYASTYLLLSEELKQTPLPFKLKSTNSFVSGKGKSRQDPEFDKEREWVALKAQELAASEDAKLATELSEQEYEDNGEGIECGCCFSSYPFDKMIQCPEAHLFCSSCMTSYASNQLGEHNPNILCMDQSGCKLPFPESELGRFLSPKLLELYHRVKQRKEIEAAGLDHLEECPFCEYQCVIENGMEKLFRCENGECGAVTCRECKKPDHLPRSCKEVEDDKHLDAQHVIEEAMTRALMRNCPKCQKSFIKEMGCNKMTCPNCHTLSCYICRSIINGYDHFSDGGAYARANAKSTSKSKCILWDTVDQPVEKRHAQEVSEAAKRALEELKKSRPDVDAKNIKVDVPPPPPRAPAPAVPVPAFNNAPYPHIIHGGHFQNYYQAPPPQPYMYAAQGHGHAQGIRARGLMREVQGLQDLQRGWGMPNFGAYAGMGGNVGVLGMGVGGPVPPVPPPVPANPPLPMVAPRPMELEVPLAHVQRKERRPRGGRVAQAQAVVADGPGRRRRGR